MLFRSNGIMSTIALKNHFLKLCSGTKVDAQLYTSIYGSRFNTSSTNSLTYTNHQNSEQRNFNTTQVIRHKQHKSQDLNMPLSGLQKTLQASSSFSCLNTKSINCHKRYASIKSLYLTVYYS